MKIGIIGAGVAGLAAAIRMACRGYEVSVFEANGFPGGKLSAFTLGQFRFDIGPSLFTMPEYVTDLFELAKASPERYFSYEAVPVVCQYFWEDGKGLTAYSNRERFVQEVEECFPGQGEKIARLLANSKLKYELTGKIFLEKSLHRWKTWVQRDIVKALLKLPSFNLFESMHQVHDHYFDDPHLVQMFDRFATYNGSNPYRAPGLLSMIPHFEHGIGAYFPHGGMHSIAKSLYRLALDLGVRFYFNRPVEKIIIENKRACGVVVNKVPYYYDRVISNMDVYFTYEQLLKGQKAPRRILSQEKSTSALIFYWGIDKTFPMLDLHNIFFSNNYHREFEYLQAGRVFEDPTVYINVTSKYQPGDAPEGSENWFTMVNAPYDRGQDWERLIEETKRNVIGKLSDMLKQDIGKHIVCEEILHPRLLEKRTFSHLGALYGTSSNRRMSAFLRHPNFSRRIRHLYFCGGSVHPGGGIPLCLLSAKIVDQLMHT